MSDEPIINLGRQVEVEEPEYVNGIPVFPTAEAGADWSWKQVQQELAKGAPF